MTNNEIEQTFLQMMHIIETLQEKISELEKENIALIKSNKSLVDWVQLQETDIQGLQHNVKYEVLDARNQSIIQQLPQMEDMEKTLELICKEHKSLSRFGDGEFATIAGKIRHKFQNEKDEKLAMRLKEVLRTEEKNLLVALADNYGDLSRYTEQSQREIRVHLSEEEREFELGLINPACKYHNAYISRPYLIFKDKNTNAPAERFQALRMIWEKRNCVFVEGKKTRLGVGNDLFDNALSIERILCPEENAFRKYDEILKECSKMAQSFSAWTNCNGACI